MTSMPSIEGFDEFAERHLEAWLRREYVFDDERDESRAAIVRYLLEADPEGIIRGKTWREMEDSGRALDNTNDNRNKGGK